MKSLIVLSAYQNTYQSEYNSDNVQINVQTYDYEISDGKMPDKSKRETL